MNTLPYNSDQVTPPTDLASPLTGREEVLIPDMPVDTTANNARDRMIHSLNRRSLGPDELLPSLLIHRNDENETLATDNINTNINGSMLCTQHTYSYIYLVIYMLLLP